MQERPAETSANVDSSAPPSVAQLAGRFREQAAAATETPATKPTRRKPPCSLPLFPPRVELGQNGEEKSPPGASHPPKVKVKSSPLIEKLQANLTFDPAALLPGASPKSPGLKAMVSPFHSPPSTPSSPGVRPRPGETEEVPVSFDQPPEGSHLPCYNKVRTRGSIKRRPPSRRFRRSQSDCGELGEFRAVEASQENGTREENGEEVFTAKSKAPGASPASPRPEGERGRRTPGPAGKPPPGPSSGTEEPEEKASTPGEAKQGEQAGQSPAREAPEPPRATSREREAGEGGPGQEEEPERAKSTEKADSAGNEEERPGHESQGAEEPEQGAVADEAPQRPPEDLKGSHVPAQEGGQGEQEERAAPQPGSGHATREASGGISMDDSPSQDTKM